MLAFFWRIMPYIWIPCFVFCFCYLKGLYLRARFTINPDKVYRMAMRRLNTSAGILEVMGAPLTGTELRAYVMSGGGLTLKNFKPSVRGKRCFLIFPIRGSERKGLVSVEVKNKKGQVCCFIVSHSPFIFTADEAMDFLQLYGMY